MSSTQETQVPLAQTLQSLNEPSTTFCRFAVWQGYIRGHTRPTVCKLTRTIAGDNRSEREGHGSVDDHNGAASFAACCSMQLLAAARALPLFGAPAVLSWSVQSDGLLALALCALHESQAELVAPRLPSPLSPAVCVAQNPLSQLLATPAEHSAQKITDLVKPVP